uniref:Uncharacterized protein n=1 Tax=Strongyloides venezuelensis TaxID=75913 RepID=A0A0K0G5V2_STRVS
MFINRKQKKCDDDNTKQISHNLIKSLNIIINYPGNRKNSFQNISIIDLPKSVEEFLSSIGKFENEEFENNSNLKKLPFECSRITSIFYKISISNV